MTTNSFDENLSVLRICDDSNSLFCLKFKVPTYLINNHKVDDLLNEYFHYYFQKNGELNFFILGYHLVQKNKHTTFYYRSNTILMITGKMPI